MEISKYGVNPEPQASPPGPGDSASTSDARLSGRRYGGIDRDERQRQRRERLISAALAVFGEQGFHASTVRDVCKRAELTSRYFYESFESMEQLFEAVYASVTRELMHQTLEVLAKTPLEPEKLVEAALRTFLQYIQEDPRRARVALIDAQTVGVGVHRISQESNRDFAAVIGGFIPMFFPKIDQLGLDVNLVANGLVGGNIRMATMWVEDKCSTPLEDILRNMLVFYSAAIEFVRKRST
jgi:AcrR family transcriptional regulator